MELIKKIFITLMVLCYVINLVSDTNFRVMTYNTLMFPEENGEERIQYFMTVFEHVQPDIILLQEIENTYGAIWLLEALNEDGEEFARAQFVSNGDSSSMLIYRTSVATLLSQDVIVAWPRDLSEYKLEINDNTVYCYSCHLKASQGNDNEEDRYQAVSALREHITTLPGNPEFIIAGDMNLYTFSEPAYEKFVADEADNSGRAMDLSDAVGHWHNNIAYSEVHSQSCREYSFGGGVGGGMDDRFDFIFVKDGLNNNSGIEYIPESYQVVGNDGQHYNQAVNEGENSVVPAYVANALHEASDHLPVYSDFVSLDNNALTIADIQMTPDGEAGDSPYLDQIVTLEGIVTATFDVGYFMQDAAGAWNGLFVYDLSNDPAIGDLISVTGKVEEYYEKTELTDISNFNIFSSNNDLPDIITVTTNAANQEKYEGVILKIENAECTNDNLDYGEWLVNDNSGDLRIDDLMFAFSPVLGNYYDIVGVIDYSYDDYKLEPRFNTDIGTSDTENDIIQTSFNLHNYPNPFMFANSRSEAITFDFKLDKNYQNVTLRVFNLKGQVVTELVNYALKEGKHSINWQLDKRTIGSGIYFYNLQLNGNIAETNKFIILK